jgi:hypothetical protein
MSRSPHGNDRLRIFDRLEQSLERLVEGPVGRVFGSRLQPAEIGRRLERAMTVNQAIALDGVIAPNRYAVRIHPEDLEVFGDYADALCVEFEDWLVGIAVEREYRFIGEVSVEFIPDPAAPRRSPKVTAALVEQGPPPGMIAPDDDAGPLPPTAPDRYALVLPDRVYGERRYPLAEGPNVVGRAPACDIVVDHPSVSRFHARIVISGRRIDLVDLDSTNGTRVNGAPVATAPLEAHDVVSFGAVDGEIAFEAPAR